MNIKKHIPNFITILNLVCGVFAILFFIESIYMYPKHSDIDLIPITQGVFLILLATVLDFLDGFTAKLLKVQSEIGAQLDSLADMITFGVAPGFLYLAIFHHYFWGDDYLKYLFILIPIFSALRLAKFNVDTQQTTYFKGIATPANAIFWIGIYFYLGKYDGKAPIILQYIFAIFVVSFSLLMISNLRMFSFKINNRDWFKGDNLYRLGLILGAIILTITFGLFTNILAAIPFIILLYILLSIHYHYTTRKTH